MSEKRISKQQRRTIVQTRRFVTSVSKAIDFDDSDRIEAQRFSRELAYRIR